MFGFGKAKLREELEIANNLLAAREQRIFELADQVTAKDEKIARIDAECDGLAQRINEYREAEARHMRAMAAQTRELGLVKDSFASMLRERDEARADAKTAQREQRVVGKALNEALADRDDARAALRGIAEMVTPGSAPIGKRMAKVAADHIASISVPIADAA